MARLSPGGISTDTLAKDVSTRSLETVRVGESSGKINAGVRNAFVGYESGKHSTACSFDTFIGYQAGMNSASSAFTTFVGAQCGAQNVNGNECVGVGYKALELSRNASQTTAVGAYALQENLSGTGTVGVGYRAGERILDGRYNTLLGTEVAQNMRTGDYNTIQGYQAGRAAFSINSNSYFGAYAGYSNSSGDGNCFIGYKSGYDVQNGNYNVGIGAYSLYSGSNMNSNVAIGPFAGGGGNVGDKNTTQSVILGSFASANGSPSQSVIIGTLAGQNTTDSGSVMIGYSTAPSIVDGSSNIMIGVGADGLKPNTSNSIAIGSIDTLVAYDSISIGNSITNTRQRSLAIGFSLTADADNTIMMGYCNSLDSFVIFKDPISSAFKFNAFEDGFNKFNISNIVYSDILESPDGESYETGRALAYGNVLSNSERPNLITLPTADPYDLTKATPSFAVITGGFLGLGVQTISPIDNTYNVPEGFPLSVSSNIADYILSSNSSFTFTPLVVPSINLSYDTISSSDYLNVHNLNVSLDLSENDVAPTINIVNFNQNTTSVPIDIIKRVVAPTFESSVQVISLSNNDINGQYTFLNIACNIVFPDTDNGILLSSCNMKYVITKAPRTGHVNMSIFDISNLSNLSYSIPPEQLFTNNADAFEITPAFELSSDIYIAPDTSGTSSVRIDLNPPFFQDFNIELSNVNSLDTKWVNESPTLHDTVTFSSSNTSRTFQTYTWNFLGSCNCFIDTYPKHGVLLTNSNSIKYVGYNPLMKDDSLSVIVYNEEGKSLKVTRNLQCDDSIRVSGNLNMLSFPPEDVLTLSNVTSSPSTLDARNELHNTDKQNVVEQHIVSNISLPSELVQTCNVTLSNVMFPIQGLSNLRNYYRVYSENINGNVSSSLSNLQEYTVAINNQAYETSNMEHIELHAITNSTSNIQYNITTINSQTHTLTYIPFNVILEPRVTVSVESNVYISSLLRPLEDPSATSNIITSNVIIDFQNINETTKEYENVPSGQTAYDLTVTTNITSITTQSASNNDVFVIYSSNEDVSRYYDFITSNAMYDTLGTPTLQSVSTLLVPSVGEYDVNGRIIAYRYEWTSNVLTHLEYDKYRTYALVSEQNIFSPTLRSFTIDSVTPNITPILKGLGPVTSVTSSQIKDESFYLAANTNIPSSYSLQLTGNDSSNATFMGRIIPCISSIKTMTRGTQTINVDPSTQTTSLAFKLDTVTIDGFDSQYLHIYKSLPGLIASSSSDALCSTLTVDDTPLLIATSRYALQEIWYFYSQNNFMQGSPLYKTIFNVNQDPFPGGTDFNTSPINIRNKLLAPNFYHSRNGTPVTINVLPDSIHIFGLSSFNMDNVNDGNVVSTVTTPTTFSYRVLTEVRQYQMRTYEYDGFPMPEELSYVPTIECIRVGHSNSSAINNLIGNFWNARKNGSYKLILEHPIHGIFRTPSTALTANVSMGDFVSSNVSFIPLDNSSNVAITARLMYEPSQLVSPSYNIQIINYFSLFPSPSNIATDTYDIPLSAGLVADGYDWTIDNNGGVTLSNETRILYQSTWHRDTTTKTIFPYVQILQTSLTIDVEQANFVSLSELVSCIKTRFANDVTFYVTKHPTYGVISSVSFKLTQANFAVYRHLGKSDDTHDIFYIGVANGPYTLCDSTICVQVNVKFLPIIQKKKLTKYLFYNTSNEAYNTPSRLDAGDISILPQPRGYIQFISPSNIIFDGSNYAPTVDISAFAFKIQAGLLDNDTMLPYPSASLEFYPSTTSNQSPNSLIQYSEYRDMFIHTLDFKINYHESIVDTSSNQDSNLSSRLQSLEYILNPSVQSILQTQRTVEFDVQIRPSWDLNHPQLEKYQTLNFQVNLLSQDPKNSISFEISKDNDRLAWSVSNGVEDSFQEGTLQTLFMPNTWYDVLLMNDDFEKKFKVFFQKQLIFSMDFMDLSQLYKLSVVFPVFAQSNIQYQDIIPTTLIEPVGDLKYFLKVQNFRTIHDIRNVRINASIYADNQILDRTLHNIVIGNSIKAKGINNLCLGTDFSAIGNENIILGNRIGKTDDMSTRNEIYQSIIIGNGNFTNSTVSDIICIGNQNLAGLEYKPVINVQQFMAKKPIIIGNTISSDYIDFHVNIGNVLLKTDVRGKQIYLGLDGEAVAIGYGENIGSSRYALDINGDIRARSIVVDNWEQFESKSIVTSNITSLSGTLNFQDNTLSNIKSIDITGAVSSSSISVKVAKQSAVTYDTQIFMKIAGYTTINGLDYTLVVPTDTTMDAKNTIGVSKYVNDISDRVFDIITRGLTSLKVIHDGNTGTINLSVGDVLVPSAKGGGLATKDTDIGGNLILARVCEDIVGIGTQQPVSVKCWITC